MTRVALADTSADILDAVDRIFRAFGGLEQVLPDRGGMVYIKPNAVHWAPHTFTDIRVLEAVMQYLVAHGRRRLAVMENCSGGNFTRLVFRVTGYTALCRKYGAKPVFLDEGPTALVEVDGETDPIEIPKKLYHEIIDRGDNTYLSLPKLKTHSMSTVTLGVKNQQAFPVHADRMHLHTDDTLHARLAALYSMTRPDFCIIEGVTATSHGHFPAEALLDECLVKPNLLIGGPDTLAVDVVGAKVLGYDVAEVEHLRQCALRKLGEGDLANIEVVGQTLEKHVQRLPHTLLGRFHPRVRIVRGRKRCCQEGCKGNSECIQEMLTNDHGGGGDWTLIFGEGFGADDLDALPGDVLLVGPCAVDELAELLQVRYPEKTIYTVNAHNDLMNNTRYQAKLAGVSPVSMVPLNPVEAGWLLLLARMHGLTARVPPLMG